MNTNTNEVTNTEEPKENPVDDSSQEPTVEDTPKTNKGKKDDVSSKLAEFENTLADYKKQIGDRDRKVSELYLQLDNLKRDKMTDEERFELDKKAFEEQQNVFKQQQIEFNKEKMRNYVSDKLSSLGYFNGLSIDEITNLKDMVLADTTDEADKRIDALANTLGKITQTKFEGAGKPAPTKQSTGSVWNPFAPDQFNVTEQHKLWKEDPSKAEQLKKAAERLK
jgi:hypothetical protein